MKLIAETQYEDQLLMSLTTFLREMGIDAEGYRQEDAIAPVFWSANELELEADALSYMSKEDRIAFLCSIEASLRSTMRRAGLRHISNAIGRAQGGHAHLNARMLRQ